MRHELLEELTELAPLLEALKEAGLADVVWACLGGNPADYKKLMGEWERQPREEVETVVARFVQELLGKALENRNVALAGNTRLRGLYDLFRSCSEVPSSVLTGLGLVRQSPDKVLRNVRQRAAVGSEGSGERILVPADAASSLVLRHGLAKTPSMAQLRAMQR